jgi:hypothetical protein
MPRVRINLTNPLARDLALAIAPRFGGTGVVENHAGRHALRAYPTKLSVSRGRWGLGIGGTNGGYADYCTLPTTLTPVESSLFALTNGMAASAKITLNASSAAMGLNASGGLSIIAAGAERCNGMTGVAGTGPAALGFSSRSYEYAVYLNGRGDIDQSSGSNFGSSGCGQLFGNGQLGGYPGTHALIYYWTRFLSAAEHLDLATDPWQLFERNTFRTYSVPASLGTAPQTYEAALAESVAAGYATDCDRAAFKAAWARHANTVIQPRL